MKHISLSPAISFHSAIVLDSEGVIMLIIQMESIDFHSEWVMFALIGTSSMSILLRDSQYALDELLLMLLWQFVVDS